MKPGDLIPAIQRRLRQGLADGLNQSADLALSDIQQHINVRSGRLKESYTVTLRATPGNLEAQVNSPLDYKLNQYPPYKSGRDRRASPGSALFVGDRFEQAARQLLEGSVKQEFD